MRKCSDGRTNGHAITNSDPTNSASKSSLSLSHICHLSETCRQSVNKLDTSVISESHEIRNATTRLSRSYLYLGRERGCDGEKTRRVSAISSRLLSAVEISRVMCTVYQMERWQDSRANAPHFPNVKRQRRVHSPVVRSPHLLDIRAVDTLLKERATRAPSCKAVRRSISRDAATALLQKQVT